jgi:peptide deformylase
MSIMPIRIFGDPVLRQRTPDLLDIDGSIAKLAEDMLVTMREAPGIGLAAPQVGILKRLFVYDLGEAPGVLVNPVIAETDGEFEYDEGCLSMPGLYLPIVRPDRIHVTGLDIDGNEVSLEVDELLGRVIQHELDHLDGVMMLDRVDPSARKQALREMRRLAEGGAPSPRPDRADRLRGSASIG